MNPRITSHSKARGFGLAIAIVLVLTSAVARAEELNRAEPQAAPEMSQAEEPPRELEPQAESMDHSAMGHDTPGQMETEQPVNHGAMGYESSTPSEQPLQPIPTLTDADRLAAFPEVHAHSAHGDSIQKYVLIDRLETWNSEDGSEIGWEATGWVGKDINRLWFRSEGVHIDGETESADVEILYGRSVARWWDLVAGVRHDFGTGPSRTFTAIGLVGVAPYKYELEATLYVGDSGRTAARLEAEYDTLLTNRLIIQWRAEVEGYGEDDASRMIGSGLSTVEAGFRLRFEITRKFAPYFGVAWERAYAGTADLRREAGLEVDDTQFVGGLRAWF